MPPSAPRRGVRAKRNSAVLNSSDVEIPDSSPTRPTKRRRKTDADLEDPPSALDSSERMNLIIQHLTMPAHQVMVSVLHSNDKNAKEHKEGIKAYAKIAGRDWTFYVKSLKITIGRPPEPKAGNATANPFSSPRAEPDGEVDIDLGPNKLVSRQHASIEYDLQGNTGWRVVVNGRNGVKLNDAFLKRGAHAPVTSGTVIEVGGVQMMFVLPDVEAEIAPVFLRKLSLPIPEAPPKVVREPKVTASPAKPPPVRASTPPNATAEAPVKPSPMQRGVMMETIEDIDYSKDTARDIKPPFSYATMIAQAILSSEEEKLTLNLIYQWIMDKYAFYRASNTGWQNSIRHNLSLNKAFQKVPRRTDEPGKGMKWQIVPEYREEFARRINRPSAKGGFRGSNPSSPANDMKKIRMPTELAMSEADGQLPQTSSPIGAHLGAMTPDRNRKITPRDKQSTEAQIDDTILDSEASPLADRKKTPYSTLAPGPSAHSPSGLSSPFYTSQNNSNAHNMSTPAPRGPRLMPPSEKQLPSSFMVNSSPAPFWKVFDAGATPKLGDSSPWRGGRSSPPLPAEKVVGEAEHDHDMGVPPSSPLRGMDSSAKEDGQLKKEPPVADGEDVHMENAVKEELPPYPSRPNPPPQGLEKDGIDGVPHNGEVEKEKLPVAEPPVVAPIAPSGKIDLARGFEKIGKYRPSTANASAATTVKGDA